MKKIILLFVFAISVVNVMATSYTWNGGSSTWNTTTNWTPNGTPGSGDDVTINSASPITITIGNSTYVNTLSVSGGSTISFAGASLFTVNSGLTFAGGTKISLTTTSSFVLGDGTATFNLTGNDASNYFTGTSGNGSLTVNNSTLGSINLFVDPAFTWFNFVIAKGTTVLKSNCLTNRLGLSSLNSQKLVLFDNVAFTLNATGSSSLGLNSASAAGYVDASATGSKFTFIGNSGGGASVFAGTNRIFANGALVNNLEMATSSVVLTPNTALKVNTLTLTNGNINNATNNITVLNGGTIIRSNQVALLAAAPIYGLASTDKVNIQYATTCTTGNELFGTMGTIGTVSVNTGVTATLSNSSVTSIALSGTMTGFSSPTVTIAAPANGVQATATCIFTGTSPNRTLLSISITNPGYGYTSAPSVTITDATGSAIGTPSVMAHAGTTIIDALNIGSGTSGTVTYPNTSAKVVTLNVKDLTVNSGSTFTCGSQTNAVTHLLNVGGIITKTGTFTAITTAITKVVDVTMNGTGSQAINSAITFNGLTISNTSAPVTVGAALNTTTLQINTGAILDMQSYALSTMTTNIGTGTIKTSVPTVTSATPLPASKTWTGTVEYNAGSAQTIVAGTYSNLTLNNTSGASLSGAASVYNVLNLTNGKITLGASDLTIGASGSISGASSSNYIVTDGAGKLTQTVNNSVAKTFPIGTSTSSYDPAIINPTSTLVYSAKVGATLSGTPASIGTTNPREWDINPASGTPTATITLTPSVATNVANPAIGYYNGAAWTEAVALLSGTSFTKAYTLAAANKFATGSRQAFFSTSKYWVGGASGNWSDITSWSTTSGGASGAAVPEAGDDVYFDNSGSNANPTVTLNTASTPTLASLNFSSSNASFSASAAYSITATDITVNSSQVSFAVEGVTVNNSLTFSGTDPRITNNAATNGKIFWLGNGNAFTLTGNSPTNYFTGNTNAYFAYNTTSPLTVYFNPTIITLGALQLTKGLITLGNNINFARLNISSLNNQEFILGENVICNFTSGGSSLFTATAGGGVVDASALGSKFTISGNNATVATHSNRIFKENTTINEFEYNASSFTFTPSFPMTVNKLTLTAGTIANATNNITINNNGTITRNAGTVTNALIYGASTNDRVNITYAGSVSPDVEATTGALGTIGTITVNDAKTLTLVAGNTLTADNVVVGNGSTGTLTYPNSTSATTLNVNNNITVNSGGIFKCGTQTSAVTHLLNVKGNIANSGTFTPFTSSVKAVDVTMNGTVAQSINSAITFNGLTISNISAPVSVGAALSVGILTINSSAILDMQTNTLSAVASTSGTGTLKTQATATAVPTGKTWAFIVDYNKTDGGQSVITGTYTGGLTMSNGSGVNTAAASLTIGNVLTLNTGSTLLLPGGISIISGIGFTGSTGLGKLQIADINTTYRIPVGLTWSGDVEYVFAGNNRIVPGNYNNLNVDDGSATRTINWGNLAEETGTISIAGTLTTSSTSYVVNKATVEFKGTDQTIPRLTVYNLKLSNTGSTTFPATNLFVRNNFEPGSIISASQGTIIFDGTSPQTIPAFTYSGLQINNASGASLSGSATVSGTLNLNSGVLTTGSNVLTVASGGTVINASATSFINGNLKKLIAASSTSKTFEIGDASVYAPVTLVFVGTIVGSTGSIQASTASGEHSQIATSGIDVAKSVNRTWTLSNPNALTGLTSYSPTFTYVAGDVDGTATTSNFIVGKYASSAWTLPTVSTKTVTTTKATGVTGFGDFAIGELAPVDILSSASESSISGSTADVTVSGASTILSITNPKTVNSLTLESGSALKFTAATTLSVTGDVIIKSDETTTFSANLGSGGISVTGNVIYQKTIDATKWYFMSFPYNISVSAITINGGRVLDSSWFIQEYNSTQRAESGAGTNWTHVTSGTLTANKGYIFGISTGTATISFPLGSNFVVSESASTINVTNYTGAANSTNHGWNLIGQPYLSKYNATNVNMTNMYKFNGLTYNLYNNDAYVQNLPIVDPFAAYFTKATANATLSFDLVSRQGVRSSVSTSSADIVFLDLTTSTGTDRTNIIMDDTQSASYQNGVDYEKMITTGTANPQVYTILGGLNYSYNVLPTSSVQNLPLAIYSKTIGSTTISVDGTRVKSLSKLLLTDNGVNPVVVTDLLTSNYSFTAAAGTNNTRFSISAQRITTNNIEIGNENSEIGMSINNGQLVVANLANNTTVRVYDALGRMIVTKTATSNVMEIKLNARGIYTVQLQSGTTVSSRKVIL